ncbi:TetR/AcrR family transcriptional regulator [Nocardia cyriacigeorgica]|uniref:TetR/AcrR family transcriptional regulator n=1 Tax=Nocardia cyriacigeorgica TaxID=135487 RepID=UPI0013BE8174|nr:TetR/AcrR family transcriptional regulator [Nocardia cyriacigeorgica]NEW51836.1 TetR/AcrR family transcriptional regulator [Nocardia cyriacigeorgica]
MDSPKKWRGQTLADRSLDRREQMLDAGEELLGTGGAAAVTMRAVIRQVNLSPRYFYETFTSREDLVVAVYDRVELELFDRMRPVRIDTGLRAAIRSIFEICARYFEEDPRRARILLREPLADETLRRHGSDRAPAFLRMLVPILGAEADAVVPTSDEDLALVATALSGALISLYLDWIDGRLVVDRDRLADTAVEVVFAMLEVTQRRA